MTINISKTTLMLAPDLETGFDPEQTKTYGDFLLAGQIAPQILKKEILILLNLLDKRESETNYYHVLDTRESLKTPFWGKFFEEKCNMESKLHLWSTFLQYALGNMSIKYANRFTNLFFYLKMKKEELRYSTTASIYTSSVEDPPNPEDVRSHILVSKNTQNMDAVIIFFDNLYEILSFILTKVSYNEENALMVLLAEAGYKRRAIIEIIKKSEKLADQIEKHIKVKCSVDIKNTTSIPNIFSEINYYQFWHKECVKRKFYLDYTANRGQLKNSVDFVLNALHEKYNIFQYKILHEKYDEHIGEFKQIFTTCPFEKPGNSLRDIFSTRLSMHCENNSCHIKECIIAKMYGSLKCQENNKDKEFISIIKNIYSVYGVLLPDILLPHAAECIFEYYMTLQLLPYSSIQEDAFTFHYLQEGGVDYNFIDQNMFKKAIDENLVQCLKLRKDGKQRIDNTSFIIGLYIWDEIHILNNKKSVMSISKKIASSHLYEMLEEKILDDDLAVKDTGEVPPNILDYCNKSYIRVRETIENDGCKLLSVEEALKRNSVKQT